MGLPAKMPAKKSDNKIGVFSINQKFTSGFHAREDPTTLTPDILIAPSQNVLTGTSGRIGSVAGYTLDGSGSKIVDSGILSNYDFLSTGGFIRNLRAGFLSAAGNDGKLQFRYKNASGVVSWLTLEQAMTNVTLSFAEFYDVTERIKLLLWVNGTQNIFEWNGAQALLASATAPTSGVIQTLNATPTAAGTNYQVGDIVNIAGGVGGQAIVTAISGGGTFGPVTGVSLYSPGTGGYSIGTGQATTAIPPFGVGTGLTVNITAVYSAGTITKQGAQTWKQAGFYSTRNKQIIINGTTYSYTGGENTTTLQGVTPDPTIPTIPAGTLIYQNYVTNSFAAGFFTTDQATGTNYLDTSFLPTVIGCGRNNQVYLGSSGVNKLYISQVNNIFFYNFSFPVRKIGEGASVILDAPATAFIALENRNDQNQYDLYISEGPNTWSVIETQRDSTLAFETISRVRMKVTSKQGALSERLVSKMKNHIIYIAQDNTANFLGYISFQYIPETVDFGWEIINDLDGYDFSNASIHYHKNYILLTVPESGLIRMFNMTDQTKEDTGSIRGVEDVDDDQPWFWEAPITYPISGFYETDDDDGIYGHAYNTSESYKLFNGGSFNGQNIAANATFAYDDKGDRTENKASDSIWVEGYISQNTQLTVTVSGDLDSFKNGQTRIIDGTDQATVAYGSGANALGKNSLGSNPLGGSNTLSTALPAWFHAIKTYPNVPNYLESVSFNTNGIDLDWEIISYGTNSIETNEGNNSITD